MIVLRAISLPSGVPKGNPSFTDLFPVYLPPEAISRERDGKLKHHIERRGFMGGCWELGVWREVRAD